MSSRSSRIIEDVGPQGIWIPSKLVVAQSKPSRDFIAQSNWIPIALINQNPLGVLEINWITIAECCLWVYRFHSPISSNTECFVVRGSSDLSRQLRRQRGEDRQAGKGQ